MHFKIKCNNESCGNIFYAKAPIILQDTCCGECEEWNTLTVEDELLGVDMGKDSQSHGGTTNG